jgi:hypothetical protein
MKRVLKVCAIVILPLLIGWLYSALSGLTLFVLRQEEPMIGSGKNNMVKGSIVSPLERLDFDQDEWAAYIVLSSDDFRKLEGKFYRNCLKLTDRETLKRMRDEWKMIYTGGDMATVTSRIVILRDNKLAFSSGIVLGEGEVEGLQSRSLGWLEPQNEGALWKYSIKFEPVLWPVIIP